MRKLCACIYYIYTYSNYGDEWRVWRMWRVCDVMWNLRCLWCDKNSCLYTIYIYVYSHYDDECLVRRVCDVMDKVAMPLMWWEIHVCVHTVYIEQLQRWVTSVWCDVKVAMPLMRWESCVCVYILDIYIAIIAMSVSCETCVMSWVSNMKSVWCHEFLIWRVCDVMAVSCDERVMSSHTHLSRCLTPIMKSFTHRHHIRRADLIIWEARRAGRGGVGGGRTGRWFFFLHARSVGPCVGVSCEWRMSGFGVSFRYAATYYVAESRCNALRHSATHCDTLQRTTTHCNALRHTATHCNTLQHTATLMDHTTVRVVCGSHRWVASIWIMSNIAFNICRGKCTSTGACCQIQMLSLGASCGSMVCCSVLQCVAVCCSVLQCFVLGCSMLSLGASCGSMVCCSVLQRVAVSCIVLYCVCGV